MQWINQLCRYGLLAILFGTMSAHAVIVGDYTVAGAPPADESSGDWDIDWDYVYRYKFSSAVAVAPHWILTAAHVADDNFPSNIVVNGVTNLQVEIVFHHPDFDPNHTNRADLALVRFAQAFPDYYPLYTGGFPTVPPQDKLSAIMIGYGRTGVVFSTYYNESPSGSGKRRWGTQRIDGTTTVSYNLGTLTVNSGIQMIFNLSDSPYEAGLGINDSGGGTFVKDGGEWKVAAINTARYGSAPDYTGVFAVSVPAYADWIDLVINPVADLDGDGIPNYWEAEYGNSITGLVASADDDEDGRSNLEEYIADTDPTDEDSMFTVTPAHDPPAYRFSFDGSTGRVYQVFERGDLRDTNLTWTASHTNLVWGSGGATVITLTNEAENVHYRVRVSLP